MQVTASTTAETISRAPTAASTGDGAASIDFQNFLQLLTAQLRYQDPTAPLDATQFVSQLASFSSVEQLVSVNKRLDDLVASLRGGELERYSGWIGLNAQVDDGIVEYSGAPTSLFIEREAAATSGQLVIKDALGREVDRRTIAAFGAAFDWDGRIDGSPASPGRYGFHVDYYDAGGALLDSRPVIVSEAISDVRLTADGAEIGLASGRRIPIDDIVGVGR